MQRVARVGLIAVLGTVLWLGAAWYLGQYRSRPRPHVFTPQHGPVFNWQQLAATPLEPRLLKSTTRHGIVTRQVMFHSEMDGKKRVDIFAYFSYPTGRRRLPGLIWIEGGLARAKTTRTVFGARRGYATLAIDFPLPGYRSTGGYPINLQMELGENPHQAPIYHGAVALLKAMSFLCAQPQVDRNRIGMAGGSWGGFYTTLMTGVDPRIKAAACLYGCGNLQLGNMWWDAYGRSERFPPALREHWRTSLDPAYRLPHCKTPIAWFSGTNDWFFWMPALMRTYHMAAGPKRLALVPNWDHALPSEVVEEAFVWLDSCLKKKPGLMELSPVKVESRSDGWWVSWTYHGPRRPLEADIMLSWGDGNWHTRYWKTLPVEFHQGVCATRLPDSREPYYLAGSVTDRFGFRVSTPLVRINPTLNSPIAPRLASLAPVVPLAPDPILMTDGCADWGGFEWDDLVFLRRHRWWTAGRLHDALTTDAFRGVNALLLKSGTTRLPILRFTAGYRHQFSFWAKADQPVSIGVRFNAGFCGSTQDQLKWATVGHEWTHLSFEVLPHEDLFFRYNASLVVPPGAQIKVDEFSFTPLAPVQSSMR